jgi:hypothetical protein
VASAKFFLNPFELSWDSYCTLGEGADPPLKAPALLTFPMLHPMRPGDPPLKASAARLVDVRKFHADRRHLCVSKGRCRCSRNQIAVWVACVPTITISCMVGLYPFIRITTMTMIIVIFLHQLSGLCVSQALSTRPTHVVSRWSVGGSLLHERGLARLGRAPAQHLHSALIDLTREAQDPREHSRCLIAISLREMYWRSGRVYTGAFLVAHAGPCKSGRLASLGPGGGVMARVSLVPQLPLLPILSSPSSVALSADQLKRQKAPHYGRRTWGLEPSV